MLSSANAPLKPTWVQMPKLALIETKRITVIKDNFQKKAGTPAYSVIKRKREISHLATLFIFYSMVIIIQVASSCSG
jgi:hypothetical protein